MEPTLLVGDVVERDPDATRTVQFSAPPPSDTGFPRHRRRWTKPKPASPPQNAPHPTGLDESEMRRIDQENRQVMASMTPQEIEEAQQEILNGLNPDLVRRLLQRANIDHQPESSPFDYPATQDQPALPPEIRIEPPEDALASPTTPKATNAPPKIEKNISQTHYDENQAPTHIPADLFPITDQPKTTHFPAPPVLPDLDPSDPNFLATLREKYFPNLPADPSKLAWMAPLPSKDSPADKESPYYPHPEIGVSALRFDFRGRFLSPRVSRSLPSNKGLHHHGEAPEAAGYTIAELARLARSAVPAQRCIAYQTLGRILYRLGRGEWGKTEDDPIAMAVWNSVKKGRVLESLVEATAGEGGHRGSRAYATEALWLFDKGGWKEQHKGR
ncbi:hypothetical protein CP533_1970 [Ophiocordyceps camponoti-saundersi (nom. inval.)]|nr:hypothetical protein CP533_1970 [Ophiocordyceps camponoti-saundersi (nom. inval.)]